MINHPIFEPPKDGTTLEGLGELESKSALHANGDIEFLIVGEDADHENLNCRCGKSIIKHYDSSKIFGISLECPSCEHIITTPDWSFGEIIPYKSIVLRRENVLVSKPIHLSRGVYLFSEKHHNSALNSSTPFTGRVKPFAQTLNLPALIDKHDQLSGGKFEERSRLIRRKGKVAAQKFPLVWAIETLNLWLHAGNHQEISPDVYTAATCVGQFIDVVSRWEHHARFRKLGADLTKAEQFFHTIAALQVATYFYSKGLPIGLSLEDRVGAPNPDLYIPLNEPPERLHLEVKAPMAIQFVAEKYLYEDVSKAVTSTIKNSSDQIRRDTQGALIITGSRMDPKFGQQLDTAVRKNLADNGHKNRNLAAIISHYPASNSNLDAINNKITSFSTRIQIHLNPHFRGSNPIEVAAEDSVGGTYNPLHHPIQYV